jgi:uncharacterized membrane protein
MRKPKNQNNSDIDIKNDPVPRKEVDKKSIQIAEHFEGPIPHPVIIGEYEKILSGAADRIIAMAEINQQHQIKYIEKNQADFNRYSFVGLCFAFVLTFLSIGGSILLYYIDKPLPASGLLGVSLTSIIGSFIFGRFGKKDNAKQS